MINGRKKFELNGITIKKNLLSKKSKIKIKNVIYDAFKPYIKLNKKFDIENFKFHKELINFRNLNPKKFGDIYDRINLNANLRSIFFEKKILNFFSETLGVSPNSLYLNGFMLRFDAPLDKKNTLNWHQDSSYYPMSSRKGEKSGICWIPITKVSKKNGTMIYIPKSHRKSIKTKPTKLLKNKTQQRIVNISKVENANKRNMNLNSGDAGLFHLNLKHRSGYNTSKKIRIVIGCAFHYMGKKFITGQERFKLNYNTI